MKKLLSAILILFSFSAFAADPNIHLRAGNSPDVQGQIGDWSMTFGLHQGDRQKFSFGYDFIKSGGLTVTASVGQLYGSKEFAGDPGDQSSLEAYRDKTDSKQAAFVGIEATYGNWYAGVMPVSYDFDVTQSRLIDENLGFTSGNIESQSQSDSVSETNFYAGYEFRFR